LTLQTGKYRALGIFLYLTLVTSIGWLVATPLAPFLMDELGLNKTQLGFLTSAVFWGTFTCSIMSGIASDKLGEKRMVVIGTAIMTTALLCFSFSRTFAFFLVSSFFIGAGFSTFGNLANRGLAIWFPPSEKAFAIGVKASGVPLGAAVGASLLPILALSFSWTYTVKLLGLFILLSGIACFFLYRERPNNHEISFQHSHEIINQTSGSFDEQLEDKNTNYTSLLTNRQMLSTIPVGMVFFTIQNIIMTFTIPYLQDTLSLPVVTAGHYLALFQVSGAISRPLFGYVGDRAFHGRRQYTLVALAIITAGFTFVLSLINLSFPWWLVTLIVFATGLMSLSWYGPYFALLTEISGRNTAGMAVGLGITFNCLGTSLGNPLFGFIVDITGSFNFGFQLFAGLLLIYAFIFLIFALRKSKKAYSGTYR